MKKFDLKSEFFRSVTVLMSGTVAAQAIGYLVSPLITRIYTPEEIGELGLYMRIVGFLSAIVTARFELSLMLPKHEGHAFLLYRLAIRIMMITSAVMILFFLLYYFVLSASGDTNLVFAAITLLSTVLVALINLGTNWSIRNKHFKQVSVQRFTNSVSANGLKVLFGYLSLGGTGLLLATAAGYLLSSLTFVRDYYKLVTNKFRTYSIKKVRVLAMEYRQFPMVNLPHVLTDLGRDLLIGTLIIGFFSTEVFGYFSHSYTILRLPLVVIGASIGQVFFQRCSEMIKNNEVIFPFVRKTIVTLFLISLIPFTLIYLYGEQLFGFVFGQPWGMAGRYAEIMTVWLMLNFLVSPLSSLPLVINKQKQFFAISLVGSVLQLAGFGVLPLWLGTDDASMLVILRVVSGSQAIFLFFVGAVMLKYARKAV